MKTLYSLIIFLLTHTVTMATDPGDHPIPGSSNTKESPYSEEARRLMEAFEEALENRREDFKERLKRGDTRLIDSENISGFAHLSKQELLQQTHNKLNKELYKIHAMGSSSGSSETPRDSESPEMSSRSENSEMLRNENSEMQRRETSNGAHSEESEMTRNMDRSSEMKTNRNSFMPMSKESEMPWGETFKSPRQRERYEMPRGTENHKISSRLEQSEVPRRPESHEMPRRPENSNMPRRGPSAIQPKTFNVVQLPNQYKQAPRNNRKQALPPAQRHRYTQHGSYHTNPLFRNHQNGYYGKHADVFRVQNVPTRGKHHSKHISGNDFVPAYRQESAKLQNQPHHHIYHDSSIDSRSDSQGHIHRGHETRDHDNISGHFEGRYNRQDNDSSFYNIGHKDHKYNDENANDFKPMNSIVYSLNEEVGKQPERPAVDFTRGHGRSRNRIPTGKSFRLVSGVENDVQSGRHEKREPPSHYHRAQHKPPTTQRAHTKTDNLHPSKAKHPPAPPAPSAPAPIATAPNGKAVFRPIPHHLEDHIDDYNPKRHSLPVPGLLQGVNGFYNGTHRECYSCSWYPDRTGGNKRSAGRDRCRYAFHHTDTAIFGISTTNCIDNCYIRVDADNSVHRGCYRGEDSISPQTLGCHKQGPHHAIYCFCTGNKCNDSNAPVYY